MTTLTANMHRLLRLIADHGPISLHVLQREENDPSITRSLRDRVDDLRGQGLVSGRRRSAGAVMMAEITEEGREALKQPPALDVLRTVAQIRDRSSNGQYDGRELQPYTGRPGAMRAFELPSVHNGRVVPRRPPIIMGCTPALKGPR